MRIETSDPRRWLAACVLIAVAASAAACGASNTTTGTATGTTETLTGVVNASSNWMQSVTVAGNGELDVQVATITPQSTITIGVGIGQLVGGQCALITYLDDMRVGSVASALVAAGTYCIDVVDVGNIQGSDTVTVTAAHP